MPSSPSRQWLLLHLGTGAAWCAILAIRGAGATGPKPTGFELFVMLLAAGWLPSWGLAWWQVRHRRLRSLMMSDLLAAGLLVLLACSLYALLFSYYTVYFLPLALLPRGVLSELLTRRPKGHSA